MTASELWRHLRSISPLVRFSDRRLENIANTGDAVRSFPCVEEIPVEQFDHR
jgi:hypothetical protein